MGEIHEQTFPALHCCVSPIARLPNQTVIGRDKMSTFALSHKRHGVRQTRRTRGQKTERGRSISIIQFHEV